MNTSQSVYFGLLLPVFSEDGLLSLDTFEDYFDHPSGGRVSVSSRFITSHALSCCSLGYSMPFKYVNTS